MKMPLTTIGLGLVLLTASVDTRPTTNVKICDAMGQAARTIAKDRDVGVSADTVRAELNDITVGADVKATVNSLITDIYAPKASRLKPDDIAAHVIKECLSGVTNFDDTK